ncbi:hypothetical protein SAMN02910317_01411 [Ruminococcaceae bacterium FB2012]|nr:hypothetical protein SAMN02910317_01411 [Ruminococcaceae bacterium FB2012]
MNELNNTETNWWKRNKKKVIIVSGIAVAVGVGFLAYKNKDVISAFVKGGKKFAYKVPQIVDPIKIEKVPEVIIVADTKAIPVNKIINNGLPFEVEGYIRNLPEGWHPSAEKIAQAADLGIELGEHQTLVNSFMKNVA